MWLRFAANAGRLRPDPFVLSLLGVVLSATCVPCRGASADVFHVLGIVAITSLFFLQGARLSRDAILSGITHWRLHATIATTTFVLFPLVGLGLSTVFPTMLPPLLWTGVLFVCALPSTVQSAIALTSIAQGNVAGAICSATASNVVGIALTPLILGILSRVRGGGVSWDGVGQVFSELLVPFIAGHLLRPWIGGWVENNRRVLSLTDRGSILLVVYAAFSAAVEHGVWHQLPPIVLLLLALIVAFILATILLTIKFASGALDFGPQDEITAMFCGSQKSLVSGVPIASALFSGTAVGPILIPIMIYYPVQIVVCAWLARRYAATSDAVTGLACADPPRGGLGRERRPPKSCKPHTVAAGKDSISTDRISMLGRIDAEMTLDRFKARRNSWCNCPEPFGDDDPNNGVALMTASKDCFPFVVSQTSAAWGITAVGTRRQNSGPVFPSPFRAWGRALRAFKSMLVQPIKTWIHLQQDVASLRCMHDIELQDIGINRTDIHAIRAGTYKRASSDDTERIMFCPEAGKAVTQAVRSNLSPPRSCTKTTDQAQELIAQADHSAR